MKFTPKSLAILKNFYSINQSICFKPGNVIRTVSSSKSILAQAEIDVEIPKEFCIYDLSRFMSSLALFNNPELEIGEREVVIRGDKSFMNYLCAAKQVILLPPEKDIDVDSNSVCAFTLTNSDLSQVFKAMSVLGLPEIAVVGEEGNLVLKGTDSDGKVQDGYDLKIGKTDHSFRITFKLENLKLMPFDYTVTIAKVPNIVRPGEHIIVSRFSAVSEKLTYYVAVSRNSVV